MELTEETPGDLHRGSPPVGACISQSVQFWGLCTVAGTTCDYI